VILRYVSYVNAVLAICLQKQRNMATEMWLDNISFGSLVVLTKDFDNILLCIVILVQYISDPFT